MTFELCSLSFDTDTKNKDQNMKINSAELGFEIPKNPTTLHNFSNFHVNHNNIDQTFVVFLYLFNNFYILKVSLAKRKYEVMYFAFALPP